MKEKALKIIDDLKKYDELYVIGHNNIDCDSYFSSYLFYKIISSFGINIHFCMLDDYAILEDDKKIIEEFSPEKPVILKRSELSDKTFVFVDHNDPDQSLKGEYNVVLSIDHHIVTNKVKNTYSIEYTSTGLFLYDLFKDVYEFDQSLKDLIAFTIMTDSCYLTTSRFKPSDKVLFDELSFSYDINETRKKYFKTTDFNLDMDFNIKNNHKVYHIEDLEINRVMIKGYDSDKKYLESYLNRSNELYDNNLFIWNDFENMLTYVYFRGELLHTYNHIVTSSILITKELISEIKVRKLV